MRILKVSTIARTIGAFLLPFIRRYRQRGDTVDIAANGATASGLADECDGIYDLNWSRSPLLGPVSLIEAMRLRRIIARGNYDIVHVHTPIAAFCTRCCLAGMDDARPVVIYTAHGFHFYSGGNPLSNVVWKTAERLAAHWTEYLVVINQEDEDFAKRSGMLPPDRVIRMPGIGVDTHALDPNGIPTEQVQRFRDQLRLASDDTLYLMVAEFNRNKRQWDALHALALIPDSKCHLAFAGSGPLFEATRDLAHRLGIAHRAHFLGIRRDIPVCMKASAAVLLASRREGLPRSIMEAFCVGTPVIATDIRGCRDLVSGNGILFPVGDHEALAAGMRLIRDDPASARRMAERASRAIRAYDIAAVTEAHDTLYSLALRSRTPRKSLRGHHAAVQGSR